MGRRVAVMLARSIAEEKLGKETKKCQQCEKQQPGGSGIRNPKAKARN